MPSYRLTLRPCAENALNTLSESLQTRFRTVFTEIAEHRQPTDHPKCEVLKHTEETLYKIRVGGYRAIARLDKPELQILKIGERETVYEDLPYHT